MCCSEHGDELITVFCTYCVRSVCNVYDPSQERGADAVLDHQDQHGGHHVLRSSFPSSHRLPEEVQPAAAAGDDVKAV